MKIKLRESLEFKPNAAEIALHHQVVCVWFFLNRAYKTSPSFFLHVLPRSAKMEGSLVLFVALVALVNGLGHYTKPQTVTYLENDDPGSALYLTPYIAKGQTDEARKLSEVNDVGSYKSYSGYFTVDAEHDSNMFFWFFPAQKGSADAPVLLWLQGGPGGPSMFGLFIENGPLVVDKSGNVQEKNVTWNEYYHMLYIDNPVGTGFSFTNSSKGLSTDENHVATNLYSALTQFFKVFNDYQKNDFYITGESYAGKYIPAIGYKIHHENPKAHLKINLVGLILGDALIDPEHMVSGYGELVYQFGLATRAEADFIIDKTKEAVKYIQKGDFEQAFAIFDFLVNGDIYPYPTYFFNVTGTTDYYNYLRTESPEEFGYYVPFINTTSTRKAIHVGKNAFHDNNPDVEMALLNDIMASMAYNFSVLLDNYKVLLYNGNLDIIVGAPLTEDFMRQLKWSGQSDYLKATKQVWRVKSSDKEVAGYIRHAKKLQQVVVRNAGHIVPFDQPERALAMVKNFIDKF